MIRYLCFNTWSTAWIAYVSSISSSSSSWKCLLIWLVLFSAVILSVVDSMSWQAITPCGRDFVRSTGSLQSKLTPHALRTFDSFMAYAFFVFLLHFKFVVIKIQCWWHYYYFFTGQTRPREAWHGRSCFGNIMLIWAVTLTITALSRKPGMTWRTTWIRNVPEW